MLRIETLTLPFRRSKNESVVPSGESAYEPARGSRKKLHKGICCDGLVTRVTTRLCRGRMAAESLVSAEVYP